MTDGKRRILFVSAPFGPAPKRVLEAVSAAMSREFADVELRAIDIFDYVNPAARAVLVKGYESLVGNAPGLWGFLFEKESLVDTLSPNENFARSVQWDALRGALAQSPPDVVVVSHPFAAAPFLRLKREGTLPLPVVSVLHDYLVHNVLIQEGISLYTCADAKLAELLVERGVERELIYPCGIPVSEAFTAPKDTAALREKFGLDPYKRTLVVLGEGFDADIADRMLFQLSLLKAPVQLLISSGENQDLADRLRRFASIYGVRAKLFGVLENLHELLAVTDLAVTQGTGLGTAELLASGVPLVLLEPAAGQDARNSKFLVERGVARLASGVLALGAELDLLLGDAALYERMKRAVAELGKPSAARDAGRAIYLAAQNAAEILQREGERRHKAQGPGPGTSASSGAPQPRPLFEDIGGDKPSEPPAKLSPGTAKELLVGWIMSEKDARRRLEEAMEAAERWQRRAELSVKEQQEDLAKEALRRAEEARREAIGLEQELRRISSEKSKLTGRGAGVAGPSGVLGAAANEPSSAELESRFRKMELDDELRRLKRRLDGDDR